MSSRREKRRAKRQAAPVPVPAVDRAPPWSVIYYRRGLTKPAIAVLDGRRKPWRTTLSAADYRAVKKLGESYKREFPRSIAG